MGDLDLRNYLIQGQTKIFIGIYCENTIDDKSYFRCWPSRARFILIFVIDLDHQHFLFQGRMKIFICFGNTINVKSDEGLDEPDSFKPLS